MSQPDRFQQLLAELEGNSRVFGGCDHCDAYVDAQPTAGPVAVVTVHHDPDCPWLAARERRPR